MSRGFPLQDEGPGMKQMFHDLAIEQEEERAKQRDLVDADFCPLCGICLPPADRCIGANFKGSICPHAEANAAQADL
jgi:Pyruvate/2-oxoacid:ferredoxin oxidoreductase delta subunit